MRIVQHLDIESFVERATPLLLAHEAHNHLILGLCAELTHNPETFGPETPLLITVEDGGVVVFVALQTPPNKLVLSHTRHTGAIEALGEELSRSERTLPGVLGPRSVAEPFGRYWAARRGGRVEQGMPQRIYQLTSVRPPPPPPGHMRLATEDDRPLLECWFSAFRAEVYPGAAPGDNQRTVTRWLTLPDRQLYLWEVDAPVAMAGAAGPTPHGVRISAVYTLPAHRRRGYASALVAAISQSQLNAGKRCCFLYADLNNPTSNHVYQAIGFEPVIDSVALRFVPREA
ncbi:MAG: GNAT family N-acetyltransferase [Chloroflexaceae bacterium]